MVIFTLVLVLKLNHKILSYIKYKIHPKPLKQEVAHENVTTIDLDAIIIKIYIKKYQLFNIFIDRRS